MQANRDRTLLSPRPRVHVYTEEVQSSHVPDFGFADQLSYDLRGENIRSNYRQNVLDHHSTQDNKINEFFARNSGSDFLVTHREKQVRFTSQDEDRVDMDNFSVWKLIYDYVSGRH